MDLKIAPPVSSLFLDPKSATGIAESCDCLEGRDATLSLEYPIELFHSDLQLIQPWDEEERASLAKVIHSHPELRVLSFHLASCYTRPVLKGGRFHPGGEKLNPDDMRRFSEENIHWLRSRFSGKLSLAVENNNWLNTEAYDHVTDADFIRLIVLENKIFLLYDHGHAQITTHGRKIPFREYYETLPIESCLQIHLSEPALGDDGFLFDAHGCPSFEAMKETVSMVAERASSLTYLTLEYYKDARTLMAANNFLHSTFSNQK